MGIPYCWNILQPRPYKSFVCFWFKVLIMDPDISFKPKGNHVWTMRDHPQWWPQSTLLQEHFLALHYVECTLCEGVCLFVIWRTWYLEGLNCIFHIFSIVRGMLGLFAGLAFCSLADCEVQGSVICEKSDSRFDLPRQVICVCKKEIGLRTEPCRTPGETGIFLS